MDSNATVRLHTGRTMPVIGLGTWGIRGSKRQAVEEALACGYRMIDTSSDYGSQPSIGELVSKGAISRESLYLVTKVEETDDAYKATLRALEELRTDYLDLILIHRPPRTGAGVDLWRGLVRAQKEGKVRDIGVSNYSEQQIQTIAGATGIVPVVNQIEWSPFGWSQQMFDFCKANNIIIQAYSPLTHGQRIDDGVLAQIAERHNKTPAQIMIRWSLQHGLVPIPKAESDQHIKENISVFDFTLNSEDMAALDSLNENFSALAPMPIYELNRKER
jgi:2,5-diketo-D-gluconate reductase A